MSDRIKEPIVKNNDMPTIQPDLPNNLAAEAPQVVDMREIGATGLRRFSGFIYDEFLPELTGWKGIAVYKEMSKNDATCYAILFAIKFLCRRVKWFVDPASEEPQDEEAAEFLETCMNDMSMTWNDTINEILSMLEFGYSVQELVYKRRCGDVFDPTMRSKYSDGRIGWRKIPIRSQDTIYRWQFDDHGGIQGVEQLAPPHYYHTTIPVEKFLLFRTTVARNNPEGESILRGAYRSWYMKHNIENIEAIGIERDLAGLPVALVPPEILSSSATIAQKQILGNIKEIVTNIRRNEQEGIIFPANYDENGKLRYELKLLSTGGTRQFDTSKIIDRYDHRIAMTVLADFVLLGQDKVGSFALASSKTNLFSTAVGAFLDIIADVFNRYAIPRLFALNDFEITDYPEIKHGDLGSVDLNELGNYIQRLAQSGMPMFPNPEIEKHLLDIAGIPSSSVQEQERAQTPGEMTNTQQKPQVEIPNSPQLKPNGAVSDRTPADGGPTPNQVVTNVDGDTERTQNMVPQNRTPEQYYDELLGPQAR